MYPHIISYSTLAPDHSALLSLIWWYCFSLSLRVATSYLYYLSDFECSFFFFRSNFYDRITFFRSPASITISTFRCWCLVFRGASDSSTLLQKIDNLQCYNKWIWILYVHNVLFFGCSFVNGKSKWALNCVFFVEKSTIKLCSATNDYKYLMDMVVMCTQIHTHILWILSAGCSLSGFHVLCA